MDAKKITHFTLLSLVIILLATIAALLFVIITLINNSKVNKFPPYQSRGYLEQLIPLQI